MVGSGIADGWLDGSGRGKMSRKAEVGRAFLPPFPILPHFLPPRPHHSPAAPSPLVRCYLFVFVRLSVDTCSSPCDSNIVKEVA